MKDTNNETSKFGSEFIEKTGHCDMYNITNRCSGADKSTYFILGWRDGVWGF